MKLVNFSSKFSNAKMDLKEAPRYVSGARMRRDAKRALKRAIRRLSRELCSQ
jgi:hypothetical protein